MMATAAADAAVAAAIVVVSIQTLFENDTTLKQSCERIDFYRK